MNMDDAKKLLEEIERIQKSYHDGLHLEAIERQKADLKRRFPKLGEK